MAGPLKKTRNVHCNSRYYDILFSNFNHATNPGRLYLNAQDNATANNGDANYIFDILQNNLNPLFYIARWQVVNLNIYQKTARTNVNFSFDQQTPRGGIHHVDYFLKRIYTVRPNGIYIELYIVICSSFYAGNDLIPAIPANYEFKLAHISLHYQNGNNGRYNIKRSMNQNVTEGAYYGAFHLKLDTKNDGMNHVDFHQRLLLPDDLNPTKDIFLPIIYDNATHMFITYNDITAGNFFASNDILNAGDAGSCDKSGIQYNTHNDAMIYTHIRGNNPLLYTTVADTERAINGLTFNFLLPVVIALYNDTVHCLNILLMVNGNAWLTNWNSNFNANPNNFQRDFPIPLQLGGPNYNCSRLLTCNNLAPGRGRGRGRGSRGGALTNSNHAAGYLFGDGSSKNNKRNKSKKKNNMKKRKNHTLRKNNFRQIDTLFIVNN